MTEESLVAALLESEGYAAFKYLGNAAFQPIGSLPAFLVEILGEPVAPDASIRLAERMPFLESFLPDAEECWNSAVDGRVDSGRWIEEIEGGRQFALEASAFRLARKRIMLIRNPEKQHEGEAQVLQRARESTLDHERLLREIQKKEILLHCVIHDLSQPLSAMRGCFSLLAAEPLTPNLRELIEIGQRQSQTQEDMIRGILNAFSAELAAQNAIQDAAGKAPDLGRCMQEIARDFSAAFAAQSVRIEVDAKVDLTREWRVRGDESRLRRIYTNLVENALRYSPPGSTVTLGVIAEGNDLRAYVDDEGPGLPADESATRIFGLFAKGKQGGGKAGLGLYFCKMTVERWGGTIGCENRPGRGSRFWFRLPKAQDRAGGSVVTAARPAANPSPKQANSTADRAEGGAPHQTTGDQGKNRARPLRLLLAEDSPVNRQLTVLLLQSRGHHVVAVENGKDALSRMEHQRFDVVILDQEMPEMGGLEATRAIREKEGLTGTHIPIVVVTGNAADADRRRCLEAGADAHLGKPFREEELYRTIEILSGNVDSGPAARQDDASIQGPFSPAELLSRVGGNPRVLRELARIFLEDTPKRISTMRNAILKQDAEALAGAAHALKGSAGMLGFAEVAEEARKIQDIGRSGNLLGASEALVSLETKLFDLEKVLARIAGGLSPIEHS